MAVKAETDAARSRPAADLRRQERRRRRIGTIAVPAIGAIGVLAVWQALIAVLRVKEYLVPAPTAVARALVDNWHMLLKNAWPTTIESLAGFAIGNLFAIGLAVVFVHSKTLEQTFYPMAVVLRTIPIVAVAPLLVLLLGQGYAPKIAIAALISFFPTLVNMVRGFGSVDPQALELMRVLSASRREVFLKLRLVNSLPFLFAALKIATGACIIGAIVAEWIGSDAGLGVLVINATTQFETPLLYATMATASVMALIFFGVVALVEKLVVRWEADEAPI
ncbi:MAG TPA: ABC transporter permease [Candidatus Dormibacteraeota bacterium]|nr:ABC transporter permease [Candidatus Dormibacteraeota bacterium]